MNDIQTTRFHTRNLTGALVITKEMNCQNISLEVMSGTCTVLGDLQLNDTPSQSIVLNEGKILNLPSRSNSPIEGVTLTAAGGTTILFINR